MTILAKHLQLIGMTKQVLIDQIDKLDPLDPIPMVHLNHKLVTLTLTLLSTAMLAASILPPESCRSFPRPEPNLTQRGPDS
jgi:hypothetical protein